MALLRGTGRQRATNIELFFDLVYVFAVTQLSHHLLRHPTVVGALQTALLLAMVWLVWVYTTWVTNWLDPERIPVRLLLVVLMPASLVLSAGLPRAFGDRGLWVGAAYAGMQIGRSAFAVAGLRGERLQRNFERILAWCMLSGALAVAGGMVQGWPRGMLWLLAVGVDLLGGAVGFRTPGLGRSTTGDWTIEGSHFAERCQAFVLIALGESIVLIGGTLTAFAHVSRAEVGGFVAAFAGAVALWWVYFDRSAEDAADVIAAAADPGRLGRSAYHFVHPIMVAGIIVAAAADERILSEPTAPADAATAWMALGGTALFLAGHAVFKVMVWRAVPWTRAAAVCALAVLAVAVPYLPAAALAGCVVAVVLAVVAADRLLHGPADRAVSDRAGGPADRRDHAPARSSGAG